MRKILFTSALILNFILFSKSGACSPVTIIKDGHAVANIIIDDNAGAQIANVAKILQYYVKMSTGATLKIQNKAVPDFASIYIGNAFLYKLENFSLRNLDQDGYILKGHGNKGFMILGKTDWGTEFGVYEFLERFLGVRWLMPTDIGIDIPKLTNLVIPESNIVESPVYLSRSLSPIDIEENTPLGQWGRFNRAKKNIEFHHNLDKLFDVNDFSKSNPNFYSTFNNAKKVPIKGDYNWQPNFSAPGIVDSAAQKIIKFFSKNPNNNSYSLGMNDSRNFDESAASLQRRIGKKNILGLENISDDYFLWANEVVKRVNAVYPNKIFGTLAYNNLFEPPSKNIGINGNIVPFITNERMRWSNPGFKIKDMLLSQNWTNKSKNVGWYDYCYGFCYLVPKVWFHTMGEYLKWGKDHNIKYYYAELYPNWGEGPKPWLLTKLLWNPDQNVDVLLDDWYNRVGGKKASPKLRKYFELWEGFWENDIQKSSWYDVDKQYLKFNDLGYMNNIPMDYITQSDQLLNDAYNLADSPIRKKRVEELLKMWNIYKLAFLAKMKYKTKDLPTLKFSEDLMAALNQLKNDSIHVNSVDRILIYINPTRK